MADFLLFTIEDRRFALPLDAVSRVVRMVEVTPLPGSPPAISGVVNVRGEVIPVFDLRRGCGFPPRPPLPSEQLLIATAGGRSLAFSVDAAEGVISLGEEAGAHAGAVPGAAEGIATVAGDIVLIYHPDRFLSDIEAILERLDHGPV